MDSEMPYFLGWSLCIKRLVHHAVYCIILVLSLVLLNTQQGAKLPTDWCELPVNMTRNRLVGSTAGATLPMLLVGVTHPGHPRTYNRAYGIIQRGRPRFPVAPKHIAYSLYSEGDRGFRSPLSISHTAYTVRATTVSGRP